MSANTECRKLTFARARIPKNSVARNSLRPETLGTLLQGSR
jgi:hypothetical protein